jgi:hypothetical protein
MGCATVGRMKWVLKTVPGEEAGEAVKADVVVKYFKETPEPREQPSAFQREDEGSTLTAPMMGNLGAEERGVPSAAFAQRPH